jgi:hypothetical protein
MVQFASGGTRSACHVVELRRRVASGHDEAWFLSFNRSVVLSFSRSFVQSQPN